MKGEDSFIQYSVVIPLLNEEDNLRPLHSRLTAVMANLRKPYEIVFVDDGSTDGSYSILKEFHQASSSTRCVRLMRNFGQQSATRAGFATTKGQVILTMDADLQNPPEEIPKLIAKLDEGYEVVFGIFAERKHSLFRRLGSDFTKHVLAKLLPVPVSNLSCFRALKREVVEQLALLPEKTRFLDGLMCWMGFRVGTVVVGHADRYAGKTKYGLFGLLSLWFDMLVSFTNLPLKIGTASGVVVGLVGLVLGLFYLIRYLMYGFAVPGFATIVILITVFAGIQLMVLGIIGEYLGRINSQVKNKPEYVVRDML